MNEDLLDAATRIGLGFTPSELTQIQQQIDARITAASSKIATAIEAKGKEAIGKVAQQAKELVTQQAAKAGQAGADAAEKAVWKAALIAGGIGIVGGGLLGFALSRRFR